VRVQIEVVRSEVLRDGLGGRPSEQQFGHGAGVHDEHQRSLRSAPMSSAAGAPGTTR
jgi:hypothetical protein